MNLPREANRQGKGITRSPRLSLHAENVGENFENEAMTPNIKDEVLIKILEGVQKNESDTFNFVVPYFLSKKIIAMHSIRNDLMFARNAIIELRKLKNKRISLISETTKITYEASLWYTVISLYGRCFTDATSKSKLELKDCFPSGKETFLATHNNLMELRHNFVAHRGETSNEQSVLILKVPKDDITALSQYKIKSVKAFSPSNEQLSQYIELIDYLAEFVRGKIQKNIEKIHSRYLEISPEILTKFLV